MAELNWMNGWSASEMQHEIWKADKGKEEGQI
jgi:hypothetical protein